ncbi:hypothetical protein VTO42DRAFT_3420 [Malbranchea cinnamomea]
MGVFRVCGTPIGSWAHRLLHHAKPPGQTLRRGAAAEIPGHLQRGRHTRQEDTARQPMRQHHPGRQGGSRTSVGKDVTWTGDYIVILRAGFAVRVWMLLKSHENGLVLRHSAIRQSIQDQPGSGLLTVLIVPCYTLDCPLRHTQVMDCNMSTTVAG